MGQCQKICEGTLVKMVDSNAISGQTFLILMLDRFSQRRKMRLEQPYPMPPRAFAKFGIYQLKTVITSKI